MIVTNLPHKHRLESQTVALQMVFNAGFFEFTGTQTVTPVIKNSVYILERFSFSANIPESEYQDALLLDNIPRITLKLKNGIETLKPIPLLNYYRDKNIATNFFTQSSDDLLEVVINARVRQSAELVEYDNIVLSLLFELYAIDSNDYNKNFRSELEPNYGSSLRK